MRLRLRDEEDGDIWLKCGSGTGGGRPTLSDVDESFLERVRCLVGERDMMDGWHLAWDGYECPCMLNVCMILIYFEEGEEEGWMKRERRFVVVSEGKEVTSRSQPRGGGVNDVSP